VVSNEHHPWAELAAELGGRGTRSVDEALGVRALSPVLEPLRRLMDASVLRSLVDPDEAAAAAARYRGAAVAEVSDLVAAAADRVGYAGTTAAIEGAILNDLEAVLALAGQVGEAPDGVDDDIPSPTARVLDAAASPERLAALMVWAVARHLSPMSSREEGSATAKDRLDPWHLGALLAEVEQGLGLSEDAARWTARATELVNATPEWSEDAPLSAGDFRGAFEDPLGSRLLGVNTFKGERFFNRERFEHLAYLALLAGAVRMVTEDPLSAPEGLANGCDAVHSLLVEAEDSGYRVEEFLAGADGAADLSDQED
jgi:hypothetical protein